MNVGAGQTGSTCWFFSSLNIFLTSDNGLKILWQKFQEVYPSLKPREKAYFNSNINAPCPYKGAVKKTSAIYFWKFLNQYICAVGGPGSLIPKSGLNAYLTKNIKWRRNATRESKGTGGGYPSWELPAILGHLGFKVGRDFRMVNYERWKYKFKNNSWTAPILMYSGGGAAFKMTDLILEKRGYSLTGAIVYVRPRPEADVMPHVWACTIRNGKGYICDSNYPTAQIECKWWLKASLERHFMTVAAPYRMDKAMTVGFDVIMYTRNEFTNKITPTCQLPKQYRPLTAANQEALRKFNLWGPNAPVVAFEGPPGEARKRFTPRVLAEAIRQRSKRPEIPKSVLNNIANTATSFQNAINKTLRAVNNQGKRYIVRNNAPEMKEFRKKLITKFQHPFPKHMFLYFWRNSKTNTDFVNAVRRYANRAGYVVPENKLKGIIAMRAKTRAGTKRAEERIYKAGNNWYNNRGNNVTSKINPANWVLNETPNKQVELAVANIMNYNGNVKTYRRR